MKITGFRPLIVTNDPESVIKTFEALGFETRHKKSSIEDGAYAAVAMKDANGNRLNVAKAESLPRDLTGIAINVDNFQEAYDFFIEKGFINPRGDKVTETGTSRATMLFAPSGFAVSISEHLKDRDGEEKE